MRKELYGPGNTYVGSVEVPDARVFQGELVFRHVGGPGSDRFELVEHPSASPKRQLLTLLDGHIAEEKRVNPPGPAGSMPESVLYQLWREANALPESDSAGAVAAIDRAIARDHAEDVASRGHPESLRTPACEILAGLRREVAGM